MALPLELTKLIVICGGPPQAIPDPETGKQKTNRDGQLLFRTEVIVVGNGRPELFGVRTTKEPKGLVVGAPIAITAPTISTFTTRDGTTGVFYEAAAIEPARATREAS
jgi:hypothetical protein